MENQNNNNRGGYNSRSGQPRNNGYQGGQNEERKSPKEFFSSFKFEEKWITSGANPTLVKFAEEVGKYMAPNNKNDKQMLSKSQIRNVFGEIKRIQLKGFKDVEAKSSFMLLKPKVAYAEGRNKTYGLSLFKLIFDKGWTIVNSIEDEAQKGKAYINFCGLLEAILAYHKAYGGKD